MQNTQYTDAPAEVYEDEEAVLEALDPGDIDSEERTISPEDQEFADMIAARRIAIKKKRMRRKRRSIVLMILVFALLFTMCSREIIRLKAALKIFFVLFYLRDFLFFLHQYYLNHRHHYLNHFDYHY